MTKAGTCGPSPHSYPIHITFQHVVSHHEKVAWLWFDYTTTTPDYFSRADTALHFEIQCGVVAVVSWGPIYKISYDLSYDYRKFIVRSTYDSDLNVLKFLSGIS